MSMHRLRTLSVPILTALTLALTTLVGVPTASQAAVPSGAIRALRTLSTFSAAPYGGSNWATPDSVSTYVTPAGDLGVVSVDTRVGALTVDTYDATTFATVGAARTISFDGWPLYGGFHTAADGTHFLLTGRSNPDEDDARAVVSVRRFDASWAPQGEATLLGGASQGIKGVYEPFAAGSADMVEVGDRLVVHMSRLMYQSGDGLRHQADLTFEVDLVTMQAASFESLGGAPYSSHSFQQLVTRAGDDLVLVDHGDAFPRAVQLSVVADYPTSRDVASYDVLELDGATGDNYTGTTVNGLVSGPSGVLVTGSSVPHRHPVDGVTGSDSAFARNVYLIAADPTTGASTFRWLTTLSPGGSATALEPRITEVGADRYAVLFSVDRGTGHSMEYRLVTSAGDVVASQTWTDAYVSPASAPMLLGSRLLWTGLDPARGAGDSAASYLFGLDLTDPNHPVRLGSTVTVSGANARLRRVGVQGGRLATAFSPTTTSYRVTVAKKWSRIVGVAADPQATVEYRLDSRRAWSRAPFSIRLAKGARATERVRVTAENGRTRTTYTFVLRRPRR